MVRKPLKNRGALMTNPERDELLIRMDERLKTIDDKLDRDCNVLYGPDDQPGTGLTQRVKTLENLAKWAVASASVAGAIVGLGVNALIAFWRK